MDGLNESTSLNGVTEAFGFYSCNLWLLSCAIVTEREDSKNRWAIQRDLSLYGIMLYVRY